MQVEVGVKCMQTNFGLRGLFSFGDFAPFHLPSKLPNFPFGPWTMQVEVDEIMHVHQVWWLTAP